MKKSYVFTLGLLLLSSFVLSPSVHAEEGKMKTKAEKVVKALPRQAHNWGLVGTIGITEGGSIQAEKFFQDGTSFQIGFGEHIFDSFQVLGGLKHYFTPEKPLSWFANGRTGLFTGGSTMSLSIGLGGQYLSRLGPAIHLEANVGTLFGDKTKIKEEPAPAPAEGEEAKEPSNSSFGVQLGIGMAWYF